MFAVKDLAEGIRNRPGVETSRRDLIKEGLDGMIVVAVEDDDVEPVPGQTAHEVDSRKPAPHDYHGRAPRVHHG